MKTGIWLCLGLSAVLVACGGSSSGDDTRVLHLRTGDYTEAQLRAEYRAEGIGEGACQTIKGLDNQAVLDIINVNFTSAEKTAAADWRKPIQTPNHDDDLRQAAILKEECDRIY